MNADARCRFYDEVLGLFWDNPDDLYWWQRSGQTHFGVQCSDFFACAGSDTQEILPGDLAALAATRDELQSLGPDGQTWWPQLWVARTRALRPHPRAAAMIPPSLRALFDAAGAGAPPQTPGAAQAV